MISEESILAMKTNIADLKQIVDNLAVNIELLEHHCEDYEKFLSKQEACTDTFLEDYAKDIDEFLNDIGKNVSDVIDAYDMFDENIIR